MSVDNPQADNTPTDQTGHDSHRLARAFGRARGGGRYRNGLSARGTEILPESWSGLHPPCADDATSYCAGLPACAASRLAAIISHRSRGAASLLREKLFFC
jgi:hypothetical protein